MELKRILEKIVDSSRKDSALKLDDTLWAYKTLFKMPIDMGKAIENWPLKIGRWSFSERRGAQDHDVLLRRDAIDVHANGDFLEKSRTMPLQIRARDAHG